MQIGPEIVVTFHYTLRDESGKQLETSRGQEPPVYLYGANNVIPGLEKAMAGRVGGDAFNATIGPEDGYGLRQADQIQRVPVKHLAYRGKLSPGDVVQLSTTDGMRAVTVIKAGRHTADIDTNHPLAGQTLVFEIEIVSTRAATAEEVAHGHVHGAGGHQH